MNNKKKVTNLDNKYIIDTAELKKGDIIFSTTFDYISKGIRKFTNSDFSHVMLYVDNNSIIHANGDGVHAYNTQRILFDDKSHCIVYRLKDSISDEELSQVITYLRSLIGRPYSIIEAMLSKIYSGKLKSEKLFCSRLIAQAFSQVNINLVENSNYCSPENIKQSNYIEKVIIPLRKLTELEKIRILTTKDKPLEQSRITNKLFVEINKLIPYDDIYDFEKLIKYLNLENKFDAEISQILRNSGYLIIWIDELIDNAVLYDPILFDNLVSNEEKEIFNKESGDTLKRFTNMYQIYLNQFTIKQLQTYKDLLILYSILVRQEQLRLSSLCKIKLKDKEDKLFQLLKTLVGLFFIKRSLNSILEHKSYESEFYNIVRKYVFDFIENFSKIENILLDFNMKNDFISISEYLKDILNILDNIIYIEMRQKRDSNAFYIKLQDKNMQLTESINKINYINIFEYS